MQTPKMKTTRSLRGEWNQLTLAETRSCLLVCGLLSILWKSNVSQSEIRLDILGGQNTRFLKERYSSRVEKESQKSSLPCDPDIGWLAPRPSTQDKPERASEGRRLKETEKSDSRRSALITPIKTGLNSVARDNLLKVLAIQGAIFLVF